MPNLDNYAESVWLGTADPGQGPLKLGKTNLSINEMKEAVYRLFDEANKGNLAIFDELFAPDFVSYGGAGFQDLLGAGAFRELYKQYLIGIPDLIFRVDQIIVEGNLAAVRGTLGGTHQGNFMGFAPPSGKHIQWTGTAIMRFNQAGLIDARWQEWDGLSVMQQLGVPTPITVPSTVDLPVQIPPYEAGFGYTTPLQNKSKALHYFEEYWNKNNSTALDELFHPQCAYPETPQYPPGPDGMKVVSNLVRDAISDYKLEILTVLADGDRVMVRNRQTGVHTGEFMGLAPSGARVTWGEISIFRFAGGQVVEGWFNVDLLGLVQQMSDGGQLQGGA